MARKSKDSKFVIYQVLYIFVITVLAIKGADLDLSEVVSKDKAVSRNVRDSLIVIIDSLNALGLKFDVKVQSGLQTENQVLKNKIENLNNNLASLSERMVESPTPESNSEVIEPKIVEENETPVPSVLPIAQVQKFIQHTWNTAKNEGEIPVDILEPRSRKVLAKILPGEEKKFDLTGENEIIARYGKHEQVLKVDKNKPPEIKIETVSSKMNSRKIYVQELQRTTTYKVTILDERPDQIKVNSSGPISITGPLTNSSGQLIYNVTLKVAPNENSFNEWMEKTNPLKESDGRYKVNFFIIASDQRTKDKVQAGESFYFTEFAR